MSLPDLLPLPLIYDGDSFIIELEQEGLSQIRILRIVRYPHNQNTTGVEHHYFDLDHDTRRAIVKQINRRHVGKTVII